MSQVWLLVEGYHYEGFRVLRAFGSEDTAQAWKARMDAHKDAEPIWDEVTMDDVNSPAFIAYAEADDAWRAACPIEGAGHGDYCDVMAVELIA